MPCVATWCGYWHIRSRFGHREAQTTSSQDVCEYHSASDYASDYVAQLQAQI
ncbi:hypothetical protein TGAMA5MH_07748 [Trichoderma gamsii]|uniref:Uncharacterized protein n=1 Tax=Trichoderma gamsii TaxID=398673 RepID=A0A2K0T4G8_9HYPO|nr:hypothetical protein TGAMA5MH_07748 [Trichoderma gamsii]